MAEPLNATFFLFHKRAQSGVIARAMLGFIAVAVVLVAAFVALTWGAWSGLFGMIAQAGKGQATNDPTPVFGVFAIFGWAFVFLFFFYVAMAAFEAACLKWMIRGEVSGFLGMNLDADTWRVYGGYWMWFAVYFAISTGVSMVATPIMFMMMPGFIRSAQESGVPDMSGIWTMQLIIATLQYIPMIYFGIRFAPGNATSIAMRKFSYFDAWKVTRGRFLPLLGSFAILWFLWFVGTALIWAIAAAGMLAQILPVIWRLITNPAAAGSTTDAEAMMAAIFAPQNLISIGVAYAIIAVGGAVIAATFMGVNARAVIAAAEDGKISAVLPDSVAKTFE